MRFAYIYYFCFILHQKHTEVIKNVFNCFLKISHLNVKKYVQYAYYYYSIPVSLYFCIKDHCAMTIKIQSYLILVHSSWPVLPLKWINVDLHKQNIQKRHCWDVWQTHSCGVSTMTSCPSNQSNKNKTYIKCIWLTSVRINMCDRHGGGGGLPLLMFVVDSAFFFCDSLSAHRPGSAVHHMECSRGRSSQHSLTFDHVTLEVS